MPKWERMLTGRLRLLFFLGPSLLVILLLFGGGLFLGLLQALAFEPEKGLNSLSLLHFKNIISSREFTGSLLLSIYISAVSTFISAAIAVCMSLALIKLADKSKIIHFLLQLPLTVPHLVVGISILFLCAPTGILSRIAVKLSIISSPSEFAILVNDPWSIGIILVYIWKEAPFLIFMLLSVLKNMGTELQEVGAVLNSSRRQRFLYITLPIIGPNLLAGCLIVFSYTLGAFEIPFLLGRTFPVPLPVWAYKNYIDIDLILRPEGIAIALLLALIIISLLIISHMLLHVGRTKGIQE